METAYDMLAAHPFLRGLTDRQLDRLSLWGTRSMFHAGNRIFREGDRADRFWLIWNGNVALDTDVPGRGDLVVETLGTDAVLGWSWLFPPYRWHFGAVAIDTSLTVEFDGPGVRELCARDPDIGYELTSRFMQVVAHRLQAARMRLPDGYAARPEPQGVTLASVRGGSFAARLDGGDGDGVDDVRDGRPA